MTVKELIKELKKHDPNERVMLSSDAEGNNYGDIGRIEPELAANGRLVVSIYPE